MGCKKTQNYELKDIKTRRRELGDNSLHVHYYERHISHTSMSCDALVI